MKEAGPVRRVVVTGLGVVSALGNSPAELWRRLVRGESAVRRIERFDCSGLPTRIAGEVLADNRSSAEAGHDALRIDRFARQALSQGLEDAALAGADLGRTGLVFAGGLGRYDHRAFFEACSHSAALDRFRSGEFVRRYAMDPVPEPLSRLNPGLLAGRLARESGLRGPVSAVMTACSAGTQAIGDAARWVRLGRVERTVVLAADSEIYPMGLASFCLLGALSRRNHDPAGASRPFAVDRDGFVLGEGGACLVLESLDCALGRDAPILAEVSGFGSSCDAYRITDPDPLGTGAELAMQQALQVARVHPSEVGYINAHGTSTRKNDVVETAALKRVFGDQAADIPVSSTKSMLGHLTVAAGALEALVCVLSLCRQQIHPTLNCREPDPECDLDYVAEGARRLEFEHAMSNSFAFGGQCASLLLSRWPGSDGRKGEAS